MPDIAHALLSRPQAPGPALVEELLHAEEVLAAAAELGSGVRRSQYDLTPSGVEAALDRAQVGLINRLTDSRMPGTERSSIAAVLVALGECRAAVRQGEAARRAETLSAVSSVGNRLNPAASIEALLERAPAEVCRIGYERCLISVVEDGHWVARSAHVSGDTDFAGEIVRAGSARPKRIDRSLLESELVRRQVTLLVTDPQANPRVHRELIDITGSRAYVAAPIVASGAVVGFIHADTSRHTGSVDEFDRELLAVSAECLSFAYERVVYRERMRRIRQSLSGYAASILEVADSADVAGSADNSPGVPPIPAGWCPSVAGILGDERGQPVERAREVREPLTQREREVLVRMSGGQRNTEIAAALFITEATVKAHVKHIFRKLGVTNRAEAVSRYLLGRA